MEFPKILYSGLPSRWMVIYTRLCAHVTNVSFKLSVKTPPPFGLQSS